MAQPALRRCPNMGHFIVGHVGDTELSLPGKEKWPDFDVCSG